MINEGVMGHTICILTYTLRGVCLCVYVYIPYSVVFISLSKCTAYVSKKVRKSVCVYACDGGREHEGEIKSE